MTTLRNYKTGVRPLRDDRAMSRISQFYGIVITMYNRDHIPPHFHTLYSGHEAQIVIDNGSILGGELPARVLSLKCSQFGATARRIRASYAI